MNKREKDVKISSKDHESKYIGASVCASASQENRAKSEDGGKWKKNQE